MRGNQHKAIKHRIQKENHTWDITKNKLFKNHKIHEKLRIQLWNALIRPTLTYALQTQSLDRQKENKLNNFAQHCIREIIQQTQYKNNKKHKQDCAYKNPTKQKRSIP